MDRINVKEGDLYIIKNNSKDYYCKVVVPYIISDICFVNGCSLIYIYNDRDTNFNTLYSIKVFYFHDKIPDEFQYAGNESVMKWEKKLDIGLRDSLNGVWISGEQIGEYEKDHLIEIIDDKRIIAVPFVSVFNEKLCHIPLIQLEGSGYTTISGLLKELL